MRRSPKALWRVSLETTAEAEEAVAALLESHFGASPSIYTEVETGRITATVFLQKQPEKPSLSAGLSRIRACGLNPGSARPSVSRVRREDWSESWKRHFQPFAVGSQLLVKPSWSRRKPARGQQTVVIDPGLSFGTGQHPTTRFCLQELARARDARRAQSFLDVGAGSGILAIAAAKMGYCPVKAIDFDPAAVRIAKQNAKANRARIAITRGDITKITISTRYDVVCANLTADLLESCAGKLRGFLKPDGLLVLAGILRSQIDSTRARFQQMGLSVVAEKTEGEWASLALAQSARFM